MTEESTTRTVGATFDPRHNSLNFLRLLLAFAVVASHAIALGLYGRDWIGDRVTIGEVAVFGFFGISGFLIARSAERNSLGRYLWQRVVRIFPAYWVCLVVTAFGIAFLGWLHVTHLFHLSSPATAYLHAPNGPWGYVVHNSYLKTNQYAIISTVWNGSLWTLYFEFLCYLLLGAFALLGVLRRPKLLLAVTVAGWLVLALCTVHPAWQVITGGHGKSDAKVLLELSLVFFTGSLIYLFRERIPDSGRLAAACGAILVASLWMPFGGHAPALTLTSTALMAPAIAYPMIWLGMHVPLWSVGSTNDYSYGVYIYAYPVTVLLGPFGVARWGYPAFLAFVVVGTLPLAVASWWLVERNALKLKHLRLPGRSQNLTMQTAEGRE